jgi:predicted alpha-1,2-mannosidase
MYLCPQTINTFIMAKKSLATIIILLLQVVNVLAADYTSFVDPFIGTGGHGHTFPGATTPFGMIQLSPDTRVNGWDACGGYYYNDTSINGFSHTHLSGTGCCDLGDVLLMPTVGKQHVEFLGSESQTKAYASPFSHKSETATPGYYSVMLDRYGVRAELTATQRAGIHRYTFSNTDSAGVILDFDYSLERQENSDMWVRAISDTEIIGHKQTHGWSLFHYTNFYIKFSRPFTYTLVNDTAYDKNGKAWPQCKMLLHFDLGTNNNVLMAKVGVSAVDPDGAKGNVESTVRGWDFDAICQAARNVWAKCLSKVDISTSNVAYKKTFYTALYHTYVCPYLFSDADGRYRGLDLKIHTTTQDRPIYTTFSCWDTFRSFHPLLTIVDPAKDNMFINSLVTKAKELGAYPMWELEGNDTGCMIGYHAVPIIVDAYVKGIRDYDTDEAYKYCVITAGYNPDKVSCHPSIKRILMAKSKAYKDSLGYIPCNLESESVAKGLEYAYDDWCIARFAEAKGDKANKVKFDRLGQNYHNYYDASTGFMRGRNSEGNWDKPFNPLSYAQNNHNYTEGNAYQYSWSVMQDIPGLIKLMGGKEQFAVHLDSLFTVQNDLSKSDAPGDITGVIGQYAHGNEPSHHIIYLYNYVGKSYKTQNLADEILRKFYRPEPDGLCGNEDCGQMSAWYIMSSMGFYQVCPGNPTYTIGRPLFDKVTINLDNGKTFSITMLNQSDKNRHIRKMVLNGKPLSTPFFTHNQLRAGGNLQIEMEP